MWAYTVVAAGGAAQKREHDGFGEELDAHLSFGGAERAPEAEL